MDTKKMVTAAEPVSQERAVEDERRNTTDRFLLSDTTLPKIARGIVLVALLFFALRSAPALLSLNAATAEAHTSALSKASVDRAAAMDHKDFWYRIYESR